MIFRSIGRTLAQAPAFLGRCALNCVHDRFGVLRPAHDEIEDYRVLRELKRLRLAGDYYDQRTLLEALRRQLRLDLKVVEKDMAISQRMLNHGIRGSIAVVPDRRYGELWVPRDLDPEELAGIMSHELAHLVANHPLPVRDLGDESDRTRFWLPRRRFAARRPPFDLKRCEHDPELRGRLLRWCEDDADIWAEHLRAFGAYGPRAFFRDKSLLNMKDSEEG